MKEACRRAEVASLLATGEKLRSRVSAPPLVHDITLDTFIFCWVLRRGMCVCL